MSIPEVIEQLKEKSQIHNKGMAGTEVVVDKELLRMASVYLEDYMLALEQMWKTEIERLNMKNENCYTCDNLDSNGNGLYCQVLTGECSKNFMKRDLPEQITNGSSERGGCFDKGAIRTVGRPETRD